MWLGVVCSLLAGALWGMVFVAPQLLPAFSPLELALGRYTAYGAIALGLMLPRLGSLWRRLRASDYAALLRHALAGNLVYYMLLAYGVKLAGVAPTSLVIGLLPISVTVAGRKDHGALPLRRLAGPLLLAAAGIACVNIDVFGHAQAGGAGPWRSLLGVLSAAAALLCWTWYTLDNTRYLKRNPHFSSVEWSALYGLASGLIALALGLAALAVWHTDVTGAAGLASGRHWPVFWLTNAVLALGASMVGNYLWNIACRRVPVTLSGALILFETLFALLYGCLHQRQWPSPLVWTALALLTAGVAWSARAHARDDDPAVPISPA